MSTQFINLSEIEENFSEIEPLFTETEAIFEANRCLYCYDAPCTKACPTAIDVPAFIKKIASSNLTGAARVIFDANPIGATCARVCPVEVLCVGACVENTLMHQPIAIGRLQRYATDAVIKKKKDLFKAGKPNGKSVGIIGSGPAGLSCATYLTRLGYSVTIYEKRPLPGGLDTYGMAEYKMQQQTSLDEVEMVKRLGVEFVLNTEVGKTISFEKLEKLHDAIFLGIGLGKTANLGIPGENLPNVHDALGFIELIKTRDWSKVPIGNTVAVIGAGNTAVDAATQAKRLGASKVLMIYRRSQKDMPAYEYEYKLAKQDGIAFYWQTMPVEIIANEDNSFTLRCVHTNLDGLDEKGRQQFKLVSGSEFDIKVDLVIKAIGQQKMISFLKLISGIKLDSSGRVIVNTETMQTSNPKFFAGGDCVNGGREAVNAAQAGKLAANGIHNYLHS